MGYVLKVFKRKESSKKRSTGIEYNHANPQLLLALAMPYLRGARIQIGRYEESASYLEKDTVNAINNCLHEISCLFEDLGAIAHYTKLCGKDHTSNNLYINIRNHIRHDARENFDVEDKRKAKRAKQLGVKDDYQINISFTKTSITIGSMPITLQSINKYLNWATKIFNTTMNDAYKNKKLTIDFIKKRG